MNIHYYISARKVLLTVLLTMVCAVATAQNSIDKAVEDFSVLGSANFTSAIKRDPKTRKIEKVVKVLEISGPYAVKLRKAFDTEARNGDLTTTRKGDRISMILAVKGSKTNRIYMLEYLDDQRHHSNHAEVTIIVKYK